MNIWVILRNIYSNPDLFDDEQYLCKSDYNVLAESIMLKEHFIGQVTALLFTENVSDNIETLKKACTYGADAACLIGFERFDFSETEQLSQIMQKTFELTFPIYDLILFGRLAIRRRCRQCIHSGIRSSRHSKSRLQSGNLYQRPGPLCQKIYFIFQRGRLPPEKAGA